MVAPEWVVQHPTLPESKMLPIAPMGSLDMLFAPAALTAQLHDQPPQGSAPQKDRSSLRASNPHRESDIYDEWARLPEPAFHLLTRVMQDRCLVGGGRLFAASELWPVAARERVDLPARAPHRRAPGGDGGGRRRADRLNRIFCTRPKNQRVVE